MKIKSHSESHIVELDDGSLWQSRATSTHAQLEARD